MVTALPDSTALAKGVVVALLIVVVVENVGSVVVVVVFRSVRHVISGIPQVKLSRQTAGAPCRLFGQSATAQSAPTTPAGTQSKGIGGAGHATAQ